MVDLEPCRNPRWSLVRGPWRKALLGLSTGIVLTGVLGWQPAVHPGPVRYWIADRDADRVLGLDAELIPALPLTVSAPVLAAPRAGGGLWVASAIDGSPLGDHRLIALDRDGHRLAEGRFGPLLDLDSDRAVGVIALEVDRGGGGRRIWNMRSSGSIRTVGHVAGAVCVATGWGQVLVGTASGRLVLYELGHQRPSPRGRTGTHDGGGTLLQSVSAGGSMGDLARGPRWGTWWALDTGGGNAVLLLDHGLRVLWRSDTGLAALHLSPVPGQELVWVADVNGPLIRRIGPPGVPAIDVRSIAVSGFDRGCALPGGGLVFTSPGAVLQIDRMGELLQTQGGFNFLVAVVPGTDRWP